MSRDIAHIAGIDEAGRGPLAGPVVTAAVILDPNHIPDGLNDSKKLSRPKREALARELMTTATIAITMAGVRRIDDMNIRGATLWAMRQAASALAIAPGHALIDGRDIPPGLPCPAEALIKGDGRSVSIAAASIVAKVTRDRLMCQLGIHFPAYGFQTHMGYGTKAHRAAIAEFGPTPHHRRSFAPVRHMLNQNQ